MDYLLGFDIGGTKTEVTLFQLGAGDGEYKVSVSGKISDIKTLASKRMPTARKDGYEAYLKNLVPLVHEVLAEKSLNVEDLSGIGMGLPGSVHPETGIMVNGNTHMMIKKDFVKDLRSALNFTKPIATNNDASCFALAEALCGAGLKYEADYNVPVSKQQSIGIILGTGCGGGLIFAGKILNGAKGGGGEIGHTTLVRDGHPCFCGRTGCAELYLSGTGLESTMANRFEGDKDQAPKAFEIFEKAAAGDALASEVVNDYREKLADFLTNLNNIYDPHFFVLGGGVSKQAAIYEGLEDVISKKMFVQGKVPNVYQHQLSDSAGVLGAAIMVL